LRLPASIPVWDPLAARPTRRPGADKYAKTALNGCSPLWHDDAWVIELVVRKKYAVTGSSRWETVVDEHA